MSKTAEFYATRKEKAKEILLTNYRILLAGGNDANNCVILELDKEQFSSARMMRRCYLEVSKALTRKIFAEHGITTHKELPSIFTISTIKKSALKIVINTDIDFTSDIWDDDEEEVVPDPLDIDIENEVNKYNSNEYIRSEYPDVDFDEVMTPTDWCTCYIEIEWLKFPKSIYNKLKSNGINWLNDITKMSFGELESLLLNYRVARYVERRVTTEGYQLNHDYIYKYKGQEDSLEI